MYKEKIPSRDDPSKKTELVHQLARVPTQEMYLEDFQGDDGEALERDGGKGKDSYLPKNMSDNIPQTLPADAAVKERRSGWFIVCPYCLESRDDVGGDAGGVPYVSNRVNNVKRHIWKMHEAAMGLEADRNSSFFHQPPWGEDGGEEQMKKETF